jgi:DNA-binding HxlR family transcriptional regulator
MTDEGATPATGKAYDNLDCSVARTLERIGERWTSLILRDAFYGLRRFDDFQASLGVARNILANRLRKLVDAEIMRKVEYQQRPVRYEYRLTEKGRDLLPVITALMAWGDKWESDDPPVTLVHKVCGKPTHARSACAACGEELDAFNVTVDPIPAIVTDRTGSRLAST